MSAGMKEKLTVLDRATIVLTASAGMSDELLNEMLTAVDNLNVYERFARRFERFLEVECKIGGIGVHVEH